VWRWKKTQALEQRSNWTEDEIVIFFFLNGEHFVPKGCKPVDWYIDIIGSFIVIMRELDVQQNAIKTQQNIKKKNLFAAQKT